MNIFGVGIGSNPREVAINPPGLSSVYSQMANYIDMTGQDGGTAGDGKIQNLKIAEAYNDLQDYQEGRSSSVSPETMALIEKLGQLKLDTNDKNAVSNEVKRLEDTFTQDAVKTDGGDRRVVDTEGEKISYLSLIQARIRPKLQNKALHRALIMPRLLVPQRRNQIKNKSSIYLSLTYKIHT